MKKRWTCTPPSPPPPPPPKQKKKKKKHWLPLENLQYTEGYTIEGKAWLFNPIALRKAKIVYNFAVGLTRKRFLAYISGINKLIQNL